MTEYAGYLTQLQRRTDAGPPEVWQTVAQIRDLNGPAGQSDQIEVSHRDDQWRHFVAGMRDGGEVTCDIIFDPDHASHDPTLTGSMWDLMETGTRDLYRLVFPGEDEDTTTSAFSAFVSNFAITSPMEGGLGANLTLKISGPTAWAHVEGA